MPRRNEKPRDVVAKRRFQDMIDAKPVSVEFPSVKRILMKLHYHDSAPVRTDQHKEQVFTAQTGAHFDLPCPYEMTRCQGGGYDLSVVVHNAIKAGETTVKGHSKCWGRDGHYTCSSELDYVIEIEHLPTQKNNAPRDESSGQTDPR